MGDFLMNAITMLGGVVGVLIGAAVIGSVIAVGLLPLVFINRPSELTGPDEQLGDREQRKEIRDRMSAHV